MGKHNSPRYAEGLADGQPGGTSLPAVRPSGTCGGCGDSIGLSEFRCPDCDQRIWVHLSAAAALECDAIDHQCELYDPRSADGHQCRACEVRV